MIGCAGRTGVQAEAVAAPAPPPRERAPAPEPPRASKSAVPSDVVYRAAATLELVRSADGARFREPALYAELARADAVCAGESHDDPHHHFGELALLQGLTRSAAVRGRFLGIGFEMFQRPFAGVLRAFARGRIGLDELVEQTEYESRWGFPFAYYRPLLEWARDQGLASLALNADQKLIHLVAQHGLGGLDPGQREALPELDFGDAEHRRRFESAMQGHPLGGASLENYYAAQVIWDETMADGAARWLAAGAPARQLLIVAGSAHCAEPAIPARIRRRAELAVTSVLLSVGPAEDAADYAYVLQLEPLGSGAHHP